MRSSPGAYVLVVYLSAPAAIGVGGLGQIDFPEGHYLYCGSAQAGLMPRLARHMRPDKKKHWHIDFLTCQGSVLGALALKGNKDTECQLADVVSDIPGVEPVVRGFGSSDCGCPTHLFHVRNDVPLSVVMDVIRSSFPDEGLNGQSI
jgi:sugar fermentation stimulation protein A